MSTCHEVSCCDDSPFSVIASVTTTYWNTRQCATVSCPGDATITATACVEANTVSSTVSQAAADSAALAQATATAQAQLSCVFTSTQEACIECPGGAVPTNLVPVMTSNSLPSGLASSTSALTGHEAYRAFDDDSSSTWASDGELPQALQYKFDSAKVITEYRITTFPALVAPNPTPTYLPTGWSFEGSNDGLNWTVVDSRSGVSFSTVAPEEKSFLFSNSTAYTYYRVLFTAVTALYGAQAVIYIVRLKLLGVGTTTICKSATRTSLVSQAAADSAAYAAALADALTTCGGSGSDVENTTPIVLPAEGWNQSYYVAAAPYPSIINIGTGNLVSKVRVTLHQVSVSANGNSWAILLRGPDGTTVVLWSDRVNANVVSVWNSVLDITFDDAAVAVTPPGPTLLVSGTYKPSNGNAQPALTIPAPAPQPNYSMALSAFIGKNPQGSWSLWVCSRLTAQVTISGGWSLNITTT